MKHKTTKLLSILLAFVMVAGLLPLGQVAYAAGDLQNVILSPEGILTWDDFSGAGCYFWSVGSFEGTTTATTFNVKGLLDSGKHGSGTYSVRLYAMDKEPASGGVRISSIWQKPYNYTSPWPQLSTPTNLKWTDNVGSWDSVPNATKYRGRLWVDSFGNTVDPINFETTSNSIDFSDYFVADTHQYAFVVYATSENYINSEYATSGWVTRTKDLSSLQNVSISSEGILTWDAFPGATLYSWSYQFGAKSGGELVEGTSVNIKHILDEDNAPSGQYTIGLHALDKHPGYGGVQLSSQWWGKYDYVFSYVFTTQPQGGTITNGGQRTVTWATNFTPVKLERYRDGVRDKSYDGDPTITSEKISAAGVYKYRAWYGTGAAEYVESDEFTIKMLHTITFNANGGNASATSATTGTDGKLASLPTATRDGYSFMGWFTQPNGGSRITTDTVFNSSTTVYARWSAKYHTITVNGGTADRSAAPPQQTVNITASTRENYTFKDWTVVSGGITLENANSATTSFKMGTQDVLIRANYTYSGPTIDTVYINITEPKADANPSDAVSAATDQYVISDTVWTDKETNTKLSATDKFVPGKTYKVKVYVRNVTSTIPFNTSAMTAYVNDSTDGVAVNLGLGVIDVEKEYTVTAQATYNVHVNIMTYDTDGVTLLSETGGTASASKDIAATGEKVTVTATPNSGYTLKAIKWGNGGTDTDITSTKEFIMKDFDVAVDVYFQKEGTVTPVKPTITTSALPGGKVGTAYNQTLAATGDATITWTLDSGNLPAGLTLAADGKISGTPSAAGDYTFTVKASNTAGDATKSFTVTIAPADTMTVTITFDPNGGSGNMDSVTISKGGSYTLPTTCGFIPPTNKEFDNKWEIVGWPNYYAPGSTWTFDEDTTIKPVWKDIVATPTAPTITTSTLPGGKVGTAYDQTLAATGDATITWTLEGGNLPAGLTLAADGKISGTPSAAGTYTFTVKASNGAGSDTKSFTVKIAAADATTYTVSFNANSGGGTMADMTVIAGEKLTLPECAFTPPSTDKEFDKWDAGNPGDKVDITADCTITAIWKDKTVVPTTYTVTFKDGENTLSTATVNSGEKVTKPADPTKTDHTFNGWYADATFTAAFDFDQQITANATVYAKFTKNSVTPPATITYSVTGGADTTWTKGSNASVTITVKRGEADDTCFSHFTGVEIDGVALAVGDYEAVSGSTVVTLKAAALQKLSVGSHTVTVKFDDGQASTGLTVKAGSGSTDKPTSPKTGDDSNLRLWVLLMLLSILGFITTVAVDRKKRQHSR